MWSPLDVLEQGEVERSILPRERWWWLILSLLLVLAAWLYYRGYDASLPYIDHPNEPAFNLAAQTIVDTGSARSIGFDAYPPGIISLNYLFIKYLKPADDHFSAVLPRATPADNHRLASERARHRLARRTACAACDRADGSGDLGCESLGRQLPALRCRRWLRHTVYLAQFVARANWRGLPALQLWPAPPSTASCWLSSSRPRPYSSRRWL